MEEPCIPVTISVNDIAAHYTSDHRLTAPDGWEGEMVFQKGDLVKLDVGVHVAGAIADNAMTIEVGNGGKHTEQIKAARKQGMRRLRRCILELPWHEIGAAAEQVHKDAGFEPIRNLCGHELTRWNLHAGTSIPAHACGADNPGFKGGRIRFDLRSRAV